MQQRLYTVLFLAIISLTSVFYYLRIVPGSCIGYCDRLHSHILDGVAGSPFKYRVLSPVAADVLAGGARDEASVMIAYLIAHTVVLPLMIAALYLWLRRWLDAGRSFGALLFLVMVLPLMFQTWAIALYSALEVVFLCAALLLILDRPRGMTLWLALLTIVATLNRETAALIPAAFFFLFVGDKPLRWVLPRTLLVGGAWLGAFAGLRLMLGTAPDDTPIAAAWALNTGGGWWTYDAVYTHVPFLFVWIGAIAGWRYAPLRLRRLSLTALLYVPLFIVFAVWNEVRLLLPLLVFALPLAFSFAYFPRQVTTQIS